MTQVNRVALIISRAQVETIEGHGALKSMAYMNNELCILGIGSSEKSGTHDNPLTADQREQAHYMVWDRKRFPAIRLRDIGATDDPQEWMDYVLRVIARHDLPEPTDFYTGSRHEARFYEGYFGNTRGEPFAHQNGFDTWTVGSRRIHIRNRAVNGVSASAVRKQVEARDIAWRSAVPAVLWAFYEDNYPPHLRAPISIPYHRTLEGPPSKIRNMMPGVAVGTLGNLGTYQEQLYMLRDDGFWRPFDSAHESLKSLGD